MSGPVKHMAEKAIRFKRLWHGHEPGEVNKTIDRGVMDVLVQRGTAEWFEAEKAKPKKLKPERGHANADVLEPAALAGEAAAAVCGGHPGRPDGGDAA